MNDAMPNARFSLDDDALRTIVTDALARAQEKGATESDAEVSEGYGQTVTVRKGTVETIEHNRDKGLGVSVSALSIDTKRFSTVSPRFSRSVMAASKPS